MSRTISEIKSEMTSAFVKQPGVIAAYGLDERKSFEDQFSVISIESVLFYVFAVAVWTLEQLLGLHEAEVSEQIERLEPHTLRWYVGKCKSFMYGQSLQENRDDYDLTGLTEEDIEGRRVVKYAVATESNTVVYLKVAGRKDGNPVPLTDGQLKAFRSYVDEIKDAGVAVMVRSEAADRIMVRLVVYYDPTILSGDGERLSDGARVVESAVQGVITELPFDGVYRNSDLLQALQQVSGVEVVDIVRVEVKPALSEAWTKVVGYNRPYSGYYALESLDVVYKIYDRVE